MPFEELLAEAFDLGQPLRTAKAVQHTSFETFRIATTKGDFLVKCLWRSPEDPDWWGSIARAMEFEQRVMDAGIRTAEPVEPLTPSFGRAARVGDQGTFRVYRWVHHQQLTADNIDDHLDWIAETLATLHNLEPPVPGAEPEWRWLGVYPPDRWTKWIDAAGAQHKPWVPLLRERRGVIERLTERLRRAWLDTGDPVYSHGDYAPYNILVAEEDPVLIDWESVGLLSSTFEAGRSLQHFGFGDEDRMTRFLHRYQGAGGVLRGQPSELLDGSLALHFAHLSETMQVVLGEIPAPGWLDLDTAEEKITERLTELPQRTRELTELAERVWP